MVFVWVFRTSKSSRAGLQTLLVGQRLWAHNSFVTELILEANVPQGNKIKRQ